jgi:hypothetical protein
MTPSLGDHIFIALIAAGVPIFGALIWRWHGLSMMEPGSTNTRIRNYLLDIVIEWALVIAVLVWWFSVNRTPGGIGFRAPGGWGFWVGAIICIVVGVFFGFQVRTALSSAKARQQIREQLSGSTELMMPLNARERRAWVGLSITAGVCEEILYRGYLIWYLMTWIPGWPAMIVAAVVFGVAHLYLEGKGILKAIVGGLIMGAAYLLTGSIWVPMVLHATLDITSGFTGGAALELADSTDRSAAESNDRPES